MKLLFDQNLSPRLVELLADAFPDSGHAEHLELGGASDLELWDFAKRQGFAIVSKDEDFNHLSVLRGSPPKFVWILLGNCTTQQVAQLLRQHITELQKFEQSDVGTLALG